MGPDDSVDVAGVTTLTPTGSPSTGSAAAANAPKPEAAGAQQAGAGKADTSGKADASGKTDASGKADASGKTDTVGKLETEIKAGHRRGHGHAVGPRVDVRRTKDGIVISLTDDIDFTMFPIGSAVPDGRLVNAMAKIAKTLASRPGEVVVRGHTRRRPFRSANYDNWQLSAARANIAHYMLVRGGLDDKARRQDRRLRRPQPEEQGRSQRAGKPPYRNRSAGTHVMTHAKRARSVAPGTSLPEPPRCSC